MKTSAKILMLFSAIFCSASFVWGQNIPQKNQTQKQKLHEFNTITLPAGFRSGLQWQKFIYPQHREKSATGFTYHIDTALVYSNGSNPQRYIYLYDSVGYKIVSLVELMTNGQWVYQSKDTATYDSVGNLLTLLSKGWSNDSWINVSLNENTYTQNHEVTAKVEKTWLGNQWIPTDSSYYTYDYNGNKVASFHASWNDTTWVSNSFNLYAYDSIGNLKLSINELWHDSLWLNNQRVTYTYDSASNLILGLIQNWGETSWTNFYQEYYTYDSARNRLSYTGEIWDDSVWVNDQHYDYTYVGRRLETGIGKNWIDSTSSWCNFEKGQYTYDTYGGIESYLYQQWKNDSVWRNVFLSQYNYDSVGNAYLGNYYVWDLTGNWSQNSDGVLQIFYNYGSIITYFTGYTVNLKYNAPLSTDVEEKTKDFVSQYNCFPNPASDRMTIQLGLKQREYVNLNLYSLTGNKISTICEGRLNNGLHSFEVPISQLSSGIYLLSLLTERDVKTIKLVIRK